MVRQTNPQSEEEPTQVAVSQSDQPGLLVDYVVGLKGISHYKIIVVKAYDYNDLVSILTNEGQIPDYYGLDFYKEIDPLQNFQPMISIERK